MFGIAKVRTIFKLPNFSSLFSQNFLNNSFGELILGRKKIILIPIMILNTIFVCLAIEDNNVPEYEELY